MVLGNWYQPLLGQSIIRLDDCNVPYVDPQEAGDDNGQNRDTLFYRTYFTEANQVRAFYIDINAFGGQQTDRTTVHAILPDSSLKRMGSLEFGNCVNCVDGFALVDQNQLVASNVSTEAAMNMWLESLGQPPYQLPGNLQTLAGVGRISGTLPACAIGLYVEYSVYSNPSNASTEFATFIHCPQILGDCTPQLSSRLACPADSLYLEARLDAACIPPGAQLRWTDRRGWQAPGLAATRTLSGHLGMYYFEITDSCCTITDSILVDIPPFADAGPDVQLCAGEPLLLTGSGGTQPFWEFSGNMLISEATWQKSGAAGADAGAYIFHAFDAGGCEDTDTVQVNVLTPMQPQLSTTAPCFGDTLFLALANPEAFQQYAWQKPDGMTLQETFIPDFQAADIGAYGFSGTDTQGCAVSDTVAVHGSPPPAFEFLVQPACDSTRIYLFPEGYDYRWSDGSHGDTLATATGGDFQLTITDTTGCQTTTTITAPAPEGPEFALLLEQAACPGDGARLQIQMADPDLPVIFSIDGGQTYGLSPQFAGLAPGVYAVQVQDELGCIQSRALVIPAPDTMGVRLPVERLEVRPNTPVSLQAETIGNIVAYQWVPGDIDSGAPATEFIAQQDMDIRLIVEDDQGCRAVAALSLTIVLGDIFVPDAFSPNGDGINDGFTFFSDLGSGEEILFLRIFDRYGGLVFSAENRPLNEVQQGWDGRLNGRDMPQGVYAYQGAVRFGNGYVRYLQGDVTLVR